jgi:hypothetical protein
MQQLFTTAGHAGTDLLDRDGPISVPLAAVDRPEDALVRRQLDEARLLAGAGDLRMARVVCAEVVFEYLLRLASDRELLRLAIATLIHAQGFQLLGRLLLAVDGRRIRVALGSPPVGTASPPHLISRSETQGVTTFTVSDRLFCDPSRDAVIDRWAEELAPGHDRRSALTAA